MSSCPRARAPWWVGHLGPGGSFVERPSIEIHVAEVLREGSRLVDRPVTLEQLRERVEVAEHGVRQLGPPDVTVLRLPSGHPFGALDDHVLARCSGVGDASQVAAATTCRLHPLAVLTGMDHHGVTGLGDLGSPVDGLQRRLRVPSAVSEPSGETWMLIDMKRDRPSYVSSLDARACRRGRPGSGD